jgi:hypothetical protein
VQASRVDVAKIAQLGGSKTLQQLVDEGLVIGEALTMPAAGISDRSVSASTTVPTGKGRPGIIVLDDKNRPSMRGLRTGLKR